jgi:hypothetical protein
MELTPRQKEIFDFIKGLLKREVFPFGQGDRRTFPYLSTSSLRPPQGAGEKRLFETARFHVERP